MPRDAQIVRQWRLWRVLSDSPRPQTAEELAASLEPDSASPRTIRRDLEVLQAVGVQVRKCSEGRTVRYAIHDDGPPLRLNGDGLLALQLALGLLRPFHETPLGECLRQLARRLESRIPASALNHFHALVDDLVVKQPGIGDASATGPVLSVLRESLARERTLEIHYQGHADPEPRTREVHPQALVYGPRGLYLLAVDPTKDDTVRTFRLERIHNARLGPTPLRQSNFDAEAHLAGSIGVHSPEHDPQTYRIRIYSELAARLMRENPWHPSQTLEAEEGGTWLLTLELTSTRELLPRVLAMAADAQVLAPESLCTEVAKSLGLARSRYDGTSSDQEARTVVGPGNRRDR